MSKLLLSTFILLASVACSSSKIGFNAENTIITYGNSTPCPPGTDVINRKCVIEFPEFGYLSLWLQDYEGDGLLIAVRLIPHQNVEVRWYGSEATVVDLNNHATLQKVRLKQNPVVGGHVDARVKMNDSRLIQFGRYIDMQFNVKPTVGPMELHFPRVLAQDKLVEIPPIQLRKTIEMMRVNFPRLPTWVVIIVTIIVITLGLAISIWMHIPQMEPEQSRTPLRILFSSVCFVASFVIAFVVLGLTADYSGMGESGLGFIMLWSPPIALICTIIANKMFSRRAGSANNP